MPCRAIRVAAIEAQVLCTPPWCDGFRIWGAGRNGRQFYQQLSMAARAKVHVVWFGGWLSGLPAGAGVP